MTWINLWVFRWCHFSQSYILYIPLYTLFTVIICINSLPPTWDPTRIILLHLRALQPRCNLTHITAGDKDPFVQSTGHELHASHKGVQPTQMHAILMHEWTDTDVSPYNHMIYYLFLLLVCAVTTHAHMVNWKGYFKYLYANFRCLRHFVTKITILLFIKVRRSTI